MKAVKIKLTQKELKEMFLYDEDEGTFTILKRYNKHLPGRVIKSNKTKCGKSYFQIDIKGTRCMFHRLIMIYMLGDKFDQDKFVDHIDGDTFNNSWDNLRVVTPYENNTNRKITDNTKTGVLGVIKRVSKFTGKITFEVQINDNGKQLYLGKFSDFFEAVCVRKSAENKYNYLTRKWKINLN